MLSKNDHSIDYIFNELMYGNASVLTSETIMWINASALAVYELETLDSDDIDFLKKIIMICNLLYNRTDMTVLPVEDGFYDLLLEKYKKYDPNFQVGSAVVQFRNFLENDLSSTRKVAKRPIRFIKRPDDIHTGEISKGIWNNIMAKDKPLMTANDLLIGPSVTYSPLNQQQKEKISKRIHDTQHNHPELVGTLDKCKFVLNKEAIDAGVFEDENVKILERDFFIKHIQQGIIAPNQEFSVIVELKYDGISVEADCNEYVISARTRGDTGVGQAADITPILYGYRFKNCPHNLIENTIGVKFEAIMTKTNLEKFNELRGRNYVNCRTAIVGLFGASDGNQFKDLITLVPLAIDRKDVPSINNRHLEVEFLNDVFANDGNYLRYSIFTGNYREILYLVRAFLSEAKIARDYLDFMYDGIVVSYLDEDIRARLGRENFINKYSMAVKFDPIEKQTIFRGYTFEIGQDGRVTPMIHYDPVEFIGTIHTKSTGSSYARFQELGLKYGDYISVKYVNDVMPYVSSLDCDHNRKNTNPLEQFPRTCPVCGSNLVLSDTGKTAFCTNIGCQARTIQRISNMFSKIGLNGFSDATAKALQCEHLYQINQLTLDQLIFRLGNADGNSLYDQLHNKLAKGIKDYILMGSLGFTGMSHRKWQAVLQQISLAELTNLYKSFHNNKINSTMDFVEALKQRIPNLGEVTTYTIATEYGFFLDDIDHVLIHWNIINSYGANDQNQLQIRFSGFRNSQLAEQLSIRYNVDADDNASVTNKTDILLVPYIGFESTKVAKARKNPNCKIMTVQELKQIYPDIEL